MLPKLATEVKPLSISDLTQQVKSMLEAGFGAVCAIGEITSLTFAGSGHVYFSLKDPGACMPAVMWKATAVKYRYAIKEGMQVIVRGKLTVYPPHGKYQFVVDNIFDAGDGAQDLALKRLKEKLQKLGYFAKERKRPIPKMPARIALVTSSSGAAIRDMLKILCRRWPCAEVWVVGVRVQGPGAAQEIAGALDRLNGCAGVDVILLGRGGGSSEDLAAFNEECVAHAIFSSKAPIISAVGHEIDFTIADSVADHRAATPSEAAEIATPDRTELLTMLQTRKQRLVRLLVGRLEGQKQRLLGLQQRRVFRLPLDRLRNEERRLDDWELRLARAWQVRLKRMRERLQAIAARLESLSPLNVLARGYSLTRTIPGKKVIRSIEQTTVGGRVEITLHDGTLHAEVKAKQSRGEE